MTRNELEQTSGYFVGVIDEEAHLYNIALKKKHKPDVMVQLWFVLIYQFLYDGTCDSFVVNYPGPPQVASPYLSLLPLWRLRFSI